MKILLAALCVLGVLLVFMMYCCCCVASEADRWIEERDRSGVSEEDEEGFTPGG